VTQEAGYRIQDTGYRIQDTGCRDARILGYGDTYCKMKIAKSKDYQMQSNCFLIQRA